MQVVLVLLEVIHQLGRDGRRIYFVRQRRPVPRVVVHADFILHLDHDHAARLVHFADMAHQGRKRAGIRFRVVLAKGGEACDASAVPALCAREAILVGLHPGGREVGVAVFPAPEPHQADALIDQPGVLDGRIHDLEVVLALLGLDPAPPYGDRSRCSGASRPSPSSCTSGTRGWMARWWAVPRPERGKVSRRRSTAWPSRASPDGEWAEPRAGAAGLVCAYAAEIARAHTTAPPARIESIIMSLLLPSWLGIRPPKRHESPDRP